MPTNEELLANIAANVARLLKDQGMTQTELARLSGEQFMTINRIVLGKNMPRTGTVYRISLALNINMAKLLEPYEKKSRKASLTR